MPIFNRESNDVLSKIKLLQREIYCLKQEIENIQQNCCGSPGECIPVSVLTQPIGGTITLDQGQPFSLSTLGAGTAPISYQWKRDGNALVGFNQTSIAISTVQSSDAGVYTCLLTNPCGAVTTNSTTLHVNTPTPQFQAFWGWVASPSNISTEADVNALQYNGYFNSGSTIVGDFRANTSPFYLVMAEPSVEPAKTIWYGSPLNTGSIGGSGNLFGTPIIVGRFRVYITNYPTQQTTTPIDFRIS